MSRTARVDNPTRRVLYLPGHLSLSVDLLHWDSVTGKPKHGAFNTYIERLIREDFSRRGLKIQG